MFKQIESAVKIGGTFFILGLCGWIWVQEQKIDSLTAENQVQAQTITQLELEQKTLQTALEEERQAVNEQQQIASELRKRTEQHREQVKVILQKEPCAATALPNAVIDSIKRLHNSNAH